MAVNAATLIGSRITAEGTVGHDRIVAACVGYPAAVRGRVTTEYAVGQRQIFRLVIHPAAVSGCRVSREDAVSQTRVAVNAPVIHPPACGIGPVAYKSAVDQVNGAIRRTGLPLFLVPVVMRV